MAVAEDGRIPVLLLVRALLRQHRMHENGKAVVVGEDLEVVEVEVGVSVDGHAAVRGRGPPDDDLVVR